MSTFQNTETLPARNVEASRRQPSADRLEKFDGDLFWPPLLSGEQQSSI
jgi:hypothetical protein